MIPKGLLPEGLKYCIAGGWAACPALASDMDVWVFRGDGSGESLEELRDRIVGHLFVTKPFKWGLQAATDDTREGGVEYDAMDFDILKVGTVKVGYPSGDVQIHLMVTTASSPMGLLSNFDISTHAVAIDANGLVIRGKHWTSIIETPYVIRRTDSTPERMKKICTRYSLENPIAKEV